MIASAIATPLASWLASRFGRKQLLLLSVAGFTLASAACGLATDLTGAVIARTLQGITGAGMVPLSQAAVLDITPPEDFGKAMAITGPGHDDRPADRPDAGRLADRRRLDWRWVYFINLPLGIARASSAWRFRCSRRKDDKPLRFDMFGFVALSIFLAAFQLMLDRGQQLDWFDSTRNLDSTRC